MIGFNVKKCILKSSLPGMYWNVWVLWSSWQDWWLKIWIYIGTKKLLISPFASSSNQTYSLCPETKTVKGKCCYSYCCLRHKKHGLVKLYNNTYTFTMSTEEFIHSKNLPQLTSAYSNSQDVMFFANAILSSIWNNLPSLNHYIKLCNIFWYIF